VRGEATDTTVAAAGAARGGSGERGPARTCDEVVMRDDWQGLCGDDDTRNRSDDERRRDDRRWRERHTRAAGAITTTICLCRIVIGKRGKRRRCGTARRDRGAEIRRELRIVAGRMRVRRDLCPRQHRKHECGEGRSCGTKVRSTASEHDWLILLEVSRRLHLPVCILVGIPLSPSA
jgi:hypothetical protein